MSQQLRMKLKDVVLIKVDFNINQHYNPTENNHSSGPDLSLGSNFIEEQNQLAVMLGVRQAEGNLPYHYEIQCAGLFELNMKPTAEFLKQISGINCPAILFPYVRETIADLTRRSGFNPLHLDSINFVELAKCKESRTEPAPPPKRKKRKTAIKPKSSK